MAAIVVLSTTTIFSFDIPSLRIVVAKFGTTSGCQCAEDRSSTAIISIIISITMITIEVEFPLLLSTTSEMVAIGVSS
jgi:hypothetical protein